MASDKRQRLVFDYLRARFRDQVPFEKKELRTVVSWKASSFDTYWSKQLKHFFVRADEGRRRRFRVGEAFRPYALWERFRQHVTQVRRVSSDYTSLVHENIIVFEFFMPLANEEHLRTSLDALFYKDAIRMRLQSVDNKKLAVHFPRGTGTKDAYLEDIATWIGARFGGYSISHVSGRFRAGPVVTLDEAAEIQKAGARYLIDETTAIVRFIFPCGTGSRREPPLSSDTFEEVIVREGLVDVDALAEAETIRWVFGVLFVQSIVQVVNGEAEIWMVESGMRSRLHIWKVES